MKKTALTILVSLFAIGSATADYQTDANNALINADRDTTSSSSFEQMAPTAAGKKEAHDEHPQLRVPEHG